MPDTADGRPVTDLHDRPVLLLRPGIAGNVWRAALIRRRDTTGTQGGAR